MKTLLGSLILLSLISVNTTNAEPNTIVIGRYLSTQLIPLNAQTDLLAQTFDVHFPYEIATIGAAISYLLNDSGYQLIQETMLDRPAAQLLNLPLPDVDRHLGPMTLLQGLQTLAGAPFQIVVDPVHRLIAFRLKESYQSQYGEIL